MEATPLKANQDLSNYDIKTNFFKNEEICEVNIF